MAYLSGYTKRQKVTIDNTKVTADLTDFPIYIDLSDMDLATDIFDTCQADGGDIRVTKSDGTTELAREIESIDTTAKTGELHVKYSGTLSSSVDTDIYIYYNGTDTEPASTATYGSEAVWSDYSAVYHLNEAVNNTAGGYKDSAGNYNGTGSSMSITAPAGQIGKAQGFDGSVDYISTGNMGISGSQNRTVSYWGKVSGGTFNYGVSWGDNTLYKNWAQTVETNIVGVRVSGGFRLFTFTNAHDGNWHYQSQQLDGTTTADIAAYGDGSTLSVSSTNTQTLNTADSGYKIAQEPGGSNFAGNIDEVRISADVKGADFANTEYANQNSASTFYSVGVEETDSGTTANNSARRMHMMM